MNKCPLQPPPPLGLIQSAELPKERKNPISCYAAATHIRERFGRFRAHCLLRAKKVVKSVPTRPTQCPNGPSLDRSQRPADSPQQWWKGNKRGAILPKGKKRQVRPEPSKVMPSRLRRKQATADVRFVDWNAYPQPLKGGGQGNGVTSLLQLIWELFWLDEDGERFPRRTHKTFSNRLSVLLASPVIIFC